MNDNRDRNEKKEEWKRNENKIRRSIILLVLAVILLIVLLAYYNSPVWVVISNIALVVGLVANIVILYEKGKVKK